MKSNYYGYSVCYYCNGNCSNNNYCCYFIVEQSKKWGKKTNKFNKWVNDNMERYGVITLD